MIVVGTKVIFDPLLGVKGVDVASMRQNVIGEVVEVNYAHQWFSVEYGCPAIRTSFKFCDIGKAVDICG